jgi:hypothetical protein
MSDFFHAYQAHNGHVDLIRFHPEYNPVHTEEWAESRLDIARKSKRRYMAMPVDSDRSYTGQYFILFIDEESGLTTVDPFHFEDWLDNIGKPF